MIASIPASIGFFYRSFTSFFMRSPCPDAACLLTGGFFVYKIS
jgi:hypothetical protein